MSLVSIKKTKEGTYMIMDGDNDTYNQSNDIIEAIEELLSRLEPDSFPRHSLRVKIQFINKGNQ